MTSNLGSTYLLNGISPDGSISDEARESVMNELKRAFRPEFLNRVDEIVLFKSLTFEEIKKIVDLLLQDLRKRLESRRITVELTDTAREFVAREGYDPVYGARPLKRFIQREIETKIAKAIISGEIKDGERIVVDVKNGGFEIIKKD